MYPLYAKPRPRNTSYFTPYEETSLYKRDSDGETVEPPFCLVEDASEKQVSKEDSPPSPRSVPSQSTNQTVFGDSRSPSLDGFLGPMSDVNNHAEWVAEMVTKHRKQVLLDKTRTVDDGSGVKTKMGGLSTPNTEMLSKYIESNLHLEEEEANPWKASLFLQSSLDKKTDARRLYKESRARSPDAMLRKLHSLQKSCVEGMGNLRIVSGNDNNLNGNFTSMQHVVNEQAKRIALLEKKLEESTNVTHNVIPAQLNYVKELETAYSCMEDELNFLRETIQRDKESYAELINVHEKERMKNEKLLAKAGMMSSYASQMQNYVHHTNCTLVEKLVRSQNKVLVKTCFDALNRELKYAKEGRFRLEKFMLKWINASLLSVFNCWRYKVAEARRSRAVVGKFLKRMRNANLFKCFRGWVELRDTQKHERAIIRRFRARMLNMEVFKCFRTWSEFKLQRRATRKMARRVFGRCIFDKVFAAFDLWKAVFDEDEMRARRKRAFIVLGRMLNKNLSKGWLVWKAQAAEAKRQESILRLFAKKMILRGVLKCWESWLFLVNKRKMVRRLMSRMINGKDALLVASSFASWRDACRERGWHEVNLLLDEKTRRIDVLEARLNMLETRNVEMGMKSAKKMVQMWRSKSLIRTFSGWRLWTQELIEERVKMDRFLRRWKNNSLSKCYETWVGVVEESKKYKRVVRKFLARVQKKGLTTCFVHWVHYVQKEKRERRVLERFKRRLANETAAKAFASWRCHVRERKWLRSLILKGLMGKLARGFASWIWTVAQMKEAEDTERRNAIILTKFIRRVQLNAAGKCLRTWQGTVRERCVQAKSSDRLTMQKKKCALTPPPH